MLLSPIFCTVNSLQALLKSFVWAVSFCLFCCNIGIELHGPSVLPERLYLGYAPLNACPDLPHLELKLVPKGAVKPHPLQIGQLRCVLGEALEKQALVGERGVAAGHVQVDIYSFGIILWELVTLMTPARGNLRPVRVPEECPPDVARLIEDCLEANLPDKRPTASVIYDRLMARCAH